LIDGRSARLLAVQSGGLPRIMPSAPHTIIAHQPHEEDFMAVKFQKPTAAFVAASWAALLIGAIVYLIGLWNASMQLNEKGYYFTILMYGLFAAVSLQKTVRDRLEGTAVTGIYYGLCWISLLLSVALLAVGLFNATLAASEKGFYAMAFLLSLFGAVAVQKNVRDIAAHKSEMPSLDDSPEAN
jgi:uncharacterized membrane protein YiaA